jgi:hypothetical protein
VDNVKEAPAIASSSCRTVLTPTIGVAAGSPPISQANTT